MSIRDWKWITYKEGLHLSELLAKGIYDLNLNSVVSD